MITKIIPNGRFLSRFQFQQIYFLLVLLWYGCMWYNSVLFSQLNDSPVLTIQNDLTYFLLYKIHFFDLITHSPTLSFIFDVSLLLSILCSLIFGSVKIFPKIFIVLYVFYFLTVFFYSGSHGHWVGLLMTCWLFMANTDKKFAIFFEFIRYYVLFHFVSAGVYKLVNSGLYHVDGFAKTIFNQNTLVIFDNPNSWHSKLVLYLSESPLLAYGLLLGGTLLELSFLIGFFTKKFDTILFFLIVVFMLSCYYFMHIIFYEMPFFMLFLICKVKPNFQMFVNEKALGMKQK
jgi:hypothetical protein